MALLLFNGLRISEALGATVGDLSYERGHRTLTVVGKGGKRRLVPLAPPTVAALDAYLGERTSGPLFKTEARAGCSGAVPLTGATPPGSCSAWPALLGWPRRTG